MKKIFVLLLSLIAVNLGRAQGLIINSPIDVPYGSYSTKSIYSDSVTVKKWLHSVARAEVLFLDKIIKTSSFKDQEVLKTMISTKIYCHFINNNWAAVLNEIEFYRRSFNDSVDVNPHHIPFKVFVESVGLDGNGFEEAYKVCLQENLEASYFPDRKNLLNEIAKVLHESPASFLQHSKKLTEVEQIKGIELGYLISSYARALLSFKVLPIIFEEVYNRENNIPKK